ncbi:hypothetical protein POM88_024888 [Heracleum sosnowskyi]|uniref:Ubiquitin-like protease family profile domain-containing protein n=1 Tax=Heracleum sosnowskyi TaxID=360622 RepID=A0AAD8I2W7_9APIA|nr:hypothetical protein POM88_024888 [Heracleum sosnowskyi]
MATLLQITLPVISRWRLQFRSVLMDPNWVNADRMSKEYKNGIKDKINAGEKNPTVSQLEAWEYARRNADGEVNDPARLQVLQDVVAIAENLPEHELTNIGTDDLLARAIPLEYPGRVRGLGWGELKTKGCNPGMQSGGSSQMDNFYMDNEVDGQHDDDQVHVLGEDLPQGKNACYFYLDPGHRYFSFVSPDIVSHLVDNSNTSLAKCFLQHVNEDHLLFVPYNVSKHWILVAINTTESIYFMDPAPVTNTTNYQNVKAFVDAAMSIFRSNSGKKYTPTMFNSFRWTKVQSQIATKTSQSLENEFVVPLNKGICSRFNSKKMWDLQMLLS